MRDFKAELFKTLSHPTRIRILDALRGGELTVRDLQGRLEVEQSSISQHLSALRGRELVATRRAGTSMHYSVADPAVWELLDIARSIFERQLRGRQALFEASH